MSTAWLTGATGAWGGAFTQALLEAGFDVLALGRRDVPAFAARAVELGRGWGFVQLDLSKPFSLAELQAAAPEPLRGVPDVFIHAAVSTEGDRAALVGADYLAPAAGKDCPEQAPRVRWAEAGAAAALRGDISLRRGCRPGWDDDGQGDAASHARQHVPLCLAPGPKCSLRR